MNMEKGQIEVGQERGKGVGEEERGETMINM